VSKLIAGQELPWRRFWTPWDGDINCGFDGRGFLAEPGKVWNPEVRPIEDLLRFRVLVLSGQPGIGKTVEVRKLERQLRVSLKPPHEIISFHCREIGSDEGLRQATVASVRWQKARAIGGQITLIVDGVDEGLRKVPEFVDALTRWLRDELPERLRVVLVCRSADWNVSAGQRLMELWPEPERGKVFELCPLQQSDAEMAATAAGLDVNAFREAVWRCRVQGLAARPLTLGMLLDEFRAGQGFPTSHRLLYARATRRLSAEVDEEREERLSHRGIKRPTEAEIHRVACRIAALLMLCGKTSVLMSSTEVPRSTDLLLRDIVGGAEAAEGRKFRVTKDIVMATLDTPLFSFRGPNRYGFDHPTFAEFLAAEYLRELPIRKLRQLLCYRLDDHDYVVPQLTEVAAWIAAEHPDFCNYLISSEPEVLLRTDVSVMANDFKQRTVAALLVRADREEAFDEMGSSAYYRTLPHPTLAAQLRPYINDPTRNLVVRRMAIEIAGDAGVSEIEDDLWRLLDSGRGDDVHNAITHALHDLAGPHSRKNLERALRSEFGSDPNDDLKGVALSKLVPTIMPVREVLPYLREERDKLYAGAYDMALRYHLPKHLCKDDLAEVLPWMKQRKKCFDTLSPLESLSKAAFSLALDHLDDPNVSKLIVELWLDKVRSYLPVPGERGGKDSLQASGLADVTKKRQFVTVLLNSGQATPDDLARYRVAILGPEDLGWLLKQLPQTPAETRPVWSQVTAGFLWETDHKPYRDLLLQVYNQTPELQAVLPTPKKTDIEVTLTRLKSARQLCQERRQRQWKREDSRLSRRQLLDDAFQVIRAGNARGWVGLTRYVYIGESEDGNSGLQGNVSHTDITTSPGWRLLGDEERRVATEAARQFLLENDDPRPTPDKYSNYAEAGYVGVRLLRACLEHDHELQKAVAEKWIAAIMDHCDKSDDEHSEMVALAYRMSPALAIERLILQLREYDQKGDAAFALHPFRECWDDSLSKTLTEYVLAHPLRPKSVKNLLVFLALRDASRATETLQRLWRRRSSKLKLNGFRRALVVVGLFYLPKQFWSVAFPLVAKGPIRSARMLFYENAFDLADRESPTYDRLTNEQTADMYLLLTRLFPPEKFHERHDAQGSVGSRHQMPGLRDGALRALVQRATASACVQIQRIVANTEPKRQIWVRWSYREALKNLLRRLWTEATPSVQTVLLLTQSPAATLVRDEDELIQALLSSLGRLQGNIHKGEFPLVVGLWNQPPKNSRRAPTPKEETFLSDLLHDWFQKDFGPAAGVIVGREVQINRVGKLDLKINAAIASEAEQRILSAIIEVKRCSNKDLGEACQRQLADKYLRPASLTHGIYLVGWYGTVRNRRFRWSHADDVEADVKSLALAASTSGLKIEGYALDCRLHPEEPLRPLSRPPCSKQAKGKP